MASSTVKVEWNGKEEYARILRTLTRNGEQIGAFVQSEVVNSISTGQPVERTKSGRLVGLDPSQPGNPPHVLHGALRGSIDYKVTRSRGDVEIRIGAYTKYARALELGNPKGGLKPRPYLRPAILNNYKTIVRKLTRGIARRRAAG